MKDGVVWIAVVINGDERMIGCQFGATVFMMGVFKKRWQIENVNFERVSHTYGQLRNSLVQDICAGGLVSIHNEVGTCIN